jgi:hypothetical protein
MDFYKCSPCGPAKAKATAAPGQFVHFNTHQIVYSRITIESRGVWRDNHEPSAILGSINSSAGLTTKSIGRNAFAIHFQLRAAD